MVEVVEFRNQFEVRNHNLPLSAGIRCPTRALAEAVADEWRDRTKKSGDRSEYPFTHLAIQAAEIKKNYEAAIADIGAYAASDLLCYRGFKGTPLARRQAKVWQPILDWAGVRYGIKLCITHDVAPIDQAPEQLDKVINTLRSLDFYQLATVAEATSITGSVIVALALLNNEIDESGAWEAGALDEIFQAQTWGDDAEAQIALTFRRRSLMAAVRFEKLARDHG